MNEHSNARPSDELDFADDYDSPWKDVLEHAFPEFMAFYFPDAHRRRVATS